MVDRMAAQIHDVAAKAPVQIGDFAGAPMLGGDKGDGGSGETKSFPPFHFVHLFEAQTVDKVAHPVGYYDGLIGGNAAKAFAVEVVKMGVGDEDEVDIGKMVVGEAGVTEAANDEQPICPVWIHEKVAMGALDQKGGVADPGDANLPMFQSGKNRRRAVAMPPFPGEERG